MRAARVGVPAGLLLLFLAPAAFACGVCLEDKVAAAYDWEVVSRATDRGQVVVFAEVKGPGAAAPLVAAARKAAARVPGVDAASVRGADAPAAISFALDKRHGPPTRALTAVEKRAGVRGLQLVLLKVMP